MTDPLIPTSLLDRMVGREIIIDGSIRRGILRQIHSNVRERRSLGDISVDQILTIAAAKGLRGD